VNIDLSSPRIGAISTKLGDVSSRISGNEPGNDSSGTEAGFAGTLRSAIEHVDAQQHTANQKTAAVDSGQSDDLIGAMLASQQASLSFSMLIQVRNKMMGAFDDVIKMQI
jgi:flagellar hook-basal body complex protein FliE